MQCKQANELLSDYVERALDPALTVSMDNHLAACGGCREEAAGLRLLWKQLEEMPVIAPPASLAATVLSALDAQQSSEEAARKAAPRRSGGILADIQGNIQALFRPRALAYGAFALLCVAGSLEVAHTQRAALDPLGALIRMVRPTPVTTLATITATRSEWMPKQPGETGNILGTLHVHLKAAPREGIAASGLMYRADLVRGDAGTISAPQTASVASAQGHFSDTSDADVALPVTAVADIPASSNMSLVITLSAPDQSGSETQKIIVPLQMSKALKR